MKNKKITVGFLKFSKILPGIRYWHFFGSVPDPSLGDALWLLRVLMVKMGKKKIVFFYE